MWQETARFCFIGERPRGYPRAGQARTKGTKIIFIGHAACHTVFQIWLIFDTETDTDTEFFQKSYTDTDFR